VARYVLGDASENGAVQTGAAVAPDDENVGWPLPSRLVDLARGLALDHELESALRQRPT
jgi:hypothetical protein